MEGEGDGDYDEEIDTGEIEQKSKSEGVVQPQHESETMTPSSPTNSTEGQVCTINTVPGTDNPMISSTSKGRLRHQKSGRFNKGGAFHAHTFAKSLATRGKTSGARGSILDMDWTPKDDTEK
jgi:hypothetical protein